MKINVCLEIGPRGTGAFAPDYPGCWVFGRTPERALEKEQLIVREWFSWLRRHGEQVPEPGEIELEVAEMLRVDYNPVEAGKPEPLFWSEIQPITPADLVRTLQLIRYSRADLLELVQGLDEGTLDWQPPGEPRTIRNCLQHIAYGEPWYLSRLGIELPGEYPEDVFELLEYTRRIVVECLSDFPKEKMAGIFQPAEDPSPVCNLWTARKVLRRLVDHERLHTRYIERILAIAYQ
jgi:predicted RNase H-like HicB family nuclease